MKSFFKNCLNGFCVVLIFPLAIFSWIEKMINPGSEVIFPFFAQLLACTPGLPGAFIRRAYYFLTIEQCSLHAIIGFGSIIVHRRTSIEKNVSIGNYVVIGSAFIGSGCEIGSRVSITSGKNQHTFAADDKWTPFDMERTPQIVIHSNVWIGEGAILMAGVGQSSLIGAGAVVTEEVPVKVVVAGNPARLVKQLQDKSV